MKPNYALSLSLDGIKFLCRLDEGWHQLGDVPLEHADLEDALRGLRQLGEDHAGGDALCKIILPNDQIKYLTLPGVSIDQTETITEALETATPYSLDELAYDFVETTEGVQVAAVAHETLGEALDFASEHGFHPVSFAAIPDPTEFNAEPFFGTTGLASSIMDAPESVGPDDAVVFVVSEGPLEKPTPEPAPPFASSRLVATPTDTGTEIRLGGAKRGVEINTDATTISPSATEDAPEVAPAGATALAAQEPRFDPATLIAGLKNRPEPSGELRLRGASRTSETDGTQTIEKPTEPKPKQSKKSKKPAPDPIEIGGKPKYLGVILIVILLVFLAGVALWSSVFSDDGLAGWFGADTPVETIALDGAQVDTLETAALPPVNNETITDTAEIEALDDREGTLIDPVLEAALPSITGDALYAATGIWDRSPAQPITPNSENAEAIYLASFETMQQTHDAIALPTPESFGIDPQIAQQSNPVAAGVTFDLDESGLVVATAAGAISPEGILVYLGKPASLPAAFPVRQAAPEVVDTAAIAEVSRLASFRPKSRPVDLVEQNERATLGGSTFSEIAAIRPKLRPERAVQVVSIDPSDIQAATDQAVLASIRPQARPTNFARTVERQKEQLASVPVPQSQTVAPSIPTTASVARNATQQNAINLRKVNLIGVYGASNDRRALVRLSNGRYKKIKIGDRIDGGKVAAISTSELRYVKGGRTIILKMPRG
ncbi:MAG: hypothetical protein JXQ85_04695 [Cognatishimia sp.]|uniref:hypothetical protein n=1 Tax=Cognatishimia sp. TaxID=2211648 RepID=UPI003B8D8934